MTISTSLVLVDNGYGTIGSALATGDTTLAFTTGHGARFPAVASGQMLSCCILNANNVLEEVQITLHAAGSDTATMVRAANGTTAKAWNAGDRIEARVSSDVLKRLQVEAMKEVVLATGDSGATYTGSISPTSYGLVTGLVYALTAATSNSGTAPTINLSSLGATTVKLDGIAPLAVGQMPVNGLYKFDGTYFILLNPRVVTRSYLAGLTLSTAGSSATMTTAAGQAADSTNVAMLNLTASLGKTTSAWAVGTGNGGLDTGSIANGTWYHFFLIMRPDTGVVDVLFSLSATAPTMPASYTLKRRIGSGLTNGSAQWTLFTQDGDYFRWSASVGEFGDVNPGTSAVTKTLTSVPTGVNVFALQNWLWQITAAGGQMIISDLVAADEAPSLTTAPLSVIDTDVAGAQRSQGFILVRTNTSAQIRYRLNNSDSNTTIRCIGLGWFDRRGRDA